METALNIICQAAIIYGLIAITATIITYNKKHPPITPQTTWSKGTHPIQIINLILSILMLIGFAGLTLGNLDPTGGGSIILLYFLLLLTTPIFIGFNIPLIWNKKIVNQEKQSLKNKNRLVITQKIFLWTTWLTGYIVITVVIIDTIISSNGANWWPL